MKSVSRLTLALGLALQLLAPGAYAQGQLPDIAPLGGGPTPTKNTPKQQPGAPETHAASGGESLLPQSSEPTLPEDPSAIPESAKKVLGSDADPESLGSTGDVRFDFYGLYTQERGKDYRYRVLFPLWADRQKPSEEQPQKVDQASLYGGVYYRRRAAGAEDDVLFPLAWNLRNPLEQSRSTIVGPFVNRRTKLESDDWFAPLYMTGSRPGGGYTIIPPLLTSLNSTAEDGFNLIGPTFCSWKGGPACDVRTARDISLGVVPFYFFGQNEDRQYEVIPPLLHYYSYQERTQSYTNLFGPYYREHTQKREMLHLLPLYYSIWGPKERHTTILPLFHYGHSELGSLLVTPFFLDRKTSEGDSTFVTWLFARHRGSTELDMYTPLYWQYRDPRINAERKILFPFLFTNITPREQTTTFFPFYSYSERYGISKSLWLTPAFNFNQTQRGWSLNILPSIFIGKDATSSHTVIAPLYFDFASPTSRTTFGLPFYYRGTDLENTSQVVGNIYYRERRFKNGREWEVHILPLFSYGESPDGHFWNIMFGLTGFKRAGTKATLRAFWLPIELSP